MGNKTAHSHWGTAVAIGSPPLLVATSWLVQALTLGLRVAPELVPEPAALARASAHALSAAGTAAAHWGCRAWRWLQALCCFAAAACEWAWQRRDQGWTRCVAAARLVLCWCRAAGRVVQAVRDWAVSCVAAWCELAVASTAVKLHVDVMATAEVGPFIPCWVLVARGAEWDEVLDFGRVPGRDYDLTLTTSGDGHRLAWALVRMVPGQFRVAVVQAAGRAAPVGVPGAAVNWVCEPPLAAAQWHPSAAELDALKIEAKGIADLVAATGVDAASVAQAGAAVAALPLYMDLGGAVPAAPAAPLVAAPQAGVALVPAAAAGGAAAAPPGAAGAAPAGVAALGFTGVGLPDAAVPADGSGMDLSSMLKEVKAIKAELEDKARARRSRSGERKGGKKDSKKKKKKVKKKKRGSSSSSRSRSGSSRTSSSDSSAYLKWGARARNRSVDPELERKLETAKFKAKGDLMAFAAKQPGALSAYFLSMVHRKLSHGRISQSKQLRRASVSQWATAHSGLSEIRDQREVQTLALVMDLVNTDDLAAAMDVLAQRIIAVQRAKSKGGNWDKAENVELLAGVGSGAAASGLLKLTA